VAWLLDENMPSGLKPLAEFYWGEDQRVEEKALKAHMRKLVRGYKGAPGPGTASGWGLLSATDIAPYAAKDAELTYRLWQLQVGLVCGLPPILGDVRPAIPRELLIQQVLGRMEAQGILINEKLLDEKARECGAELATREFNFRVCTGASLTSPKQLAALLFDVYGIEAKNRSTSRAALEALTPKNETQKERIDNILEHRRLKKAMTGYLVPLKARIGRDGRIHAGFSSTGTVTGRFSCSNPNLQTIPRSDTLAGIRELFVPEDGFELWGYDLSAAEMRVIAGMAGEGVLISSINEGRDMHGELAAEVFGPEYTPLQRRFAKNLGYGWFYGLTSLKTAVKYISGPGAEKIAKQILDGLKGRYGKVYRLMQRTTKQAQTDGYVPIHEWAWPGRFRRFVTQSVRRPAPFTALNGQVQGGIGEFMKDVMIVGEPLVNEVGARLVLQVHDELVLEVPIGLGLKVHGILQSVADDLNPFAMPMVFEASEWGKHE
jgi:DNA polymerase I